MDTLEATASTHPRNQVVSCRPHGSQHLHSAMCGQPLTAAGTLDDDLVAGIGHAIQVVQGTVTMMGS